MRIDADIIVLAGGLGERLRHVTGDTQKVMAPIAGRPFLRYLLDGLLAQGARRFVLAAGYRAEQLEAYFGDRYGGAEIVWSREETPLGTGGAIRQALERCETEDAIVVNGDTYFDVDLSALLRSHRETGAKLTLCLKKMTDFDRYGTVDMDEAGRIVGFREKKPVKEGLINGGVYAVGKSALPRLPEGRFSFEKEVLEPLAFPTYGMVSDGYFIDIGVPSDYFRAQTEIPLRFGQTVFPAAFLDRDGVINKEKRHLWKVEDFEFIEGAPQAMARLREQGYLIIVVTNQAGVAKGFYTEDDIAVLHDHIKELLRDVAYIDAFYYCPYHPRGQVEKYRVDSRDRKPGPGMIERAAADFKAKGITIDLARSILVGDTEKDIETGINAGIGRKILVRSGHPIPDEAKSRADAIFDSLADVMI
ncbi:MAG: HAD-IIIA family hydrolase [Clostridia bacterium]|nr:HAD-IIIA family hydrolase [Clostridia bacterium]